MTDIELLKKLANLNVCDGTCNRKMSCVECIAKEILKTINEQIHNEVYYLKKLYPNLEEHIKKENKIKYQEFVANLNKNLVYPKK